MGEKSLILVYIFLLRFMFFMGISKYPLVCFLWRYYEPLLGTRQGNLQTVTIVTLSYNCPKREQKGKITTLKPGVCQ